MSTSMSRLASIAFARAIPAPELLLHPPLPWMYVEGYVVIPEHEALISALWTD